MNSWKNWLILPGEAGKEGLNFGIPTLGKTHLCFPSCFGTLIIPSASESASAEGADLLIAAIDLGVNF